MRLLFLSNVFPNPLNPQKGTFNCSLMTELARRHAVQVVSPVSWTDEISACVRRRRTIDRTISHSVEQVSVEYPRYYYPPKFFRGSYGRWMWFSIQRRLREAAERFQPEAILSYWAHPDGEVALRLARELKVPGVVMVGGSDVLLLARSGRRREAILNVLHSADAVVAVSEDLRQQLIRDGIDAAHIHVVPRGIDRSLFFPNSPLPVIQTAGMFGPSSELADAHPIAGNESNIFESANAPWQVANGAPAERAATDLSKTQKNLLAVGRLVPVKGFETLIEATRILRNRGIAIQTTIVGGGPLAKPLWNQIQESDLDEFVKIVGPQPQSVLAKCYRAADLVVLPSLSEGIPNVLLEAIACGARFVASQVGGVPEIADREWDRLVPPGDPFALANACERMLSSKPPKNPRRFLPLSWNDSANQLMEIIERICFNVELTQSREVVHA